MCTFDFIKSNLENLPTPKYDQFILDLQLESQAFTNQIASVITEIVESEMISIDQLESLINILQRSEELFSIKKNRLIKIELSQYLELVRRSPTVDNFNYVLLKKPVGTISTAKMKTLSFRPLVKKINYKGETISDQFYAFKKNECSKSELSATGNEYFSGQSYSFVEEKNCSWTDSISGIFSDSKPTTLANHGGTANSESSYKLTKRDKNVLLWSALAIGAGLFLSHYELQIEY